MDLEKIRYKILWKIDEEIAVSPFTEGKYQLIFRIGKITNGVPGTVGVSTFEKEIQAFNFRRLSYLQDEMFAIFRVEGIGEEVKRPFLSYFTREKSITEFYRQLKEVPPGSRTVMEMLSPPGTVCYPAVRVLEEVK